MKFLKATLIALLLVIATGPAQAADADADIRDLLAAQVEAWNKGNVESFVTSYAENCTFMGKQVVHSREKVLARYRKTYPTPAAMGKLAFSDIEVREIGEHTAIATGTYHLTRAAQGGGNTGGYFSLVLKDVDDEWKIVLDHSTSVK